MNEKRISRDELDQIKFNQEIEYEGTIGNLELSLEDMVATYNVLGSVERAKGTEAREKLCKCLKEIADPDKAAKDDLVEIMVEVPEIRKEVDRGWKTTIEQLQGAVETRIKSVIDNRTKEVTALTALVALFTSTVVMTNAVSGNLIHVGPFLFVAGTLSYPVTFLLSDILSEVFGKKQAKKAVWLGFIAQIISVAFLFGIMRFQSASAEMGEAFHRVFAPVTRIVVASMVAYVVAQMVDVYVFHYIKKKTDGRWLWMRNNAATIIAQAIDTIIFVAIAFAGVLTSGQLVAMFLGQYAAKVLLAAADTPLCYLGVHLARRYISGK